MKASEQQVLIPQEATPDTLIDLIGKTQQVTNQKAKQTSGDLPENSQANGEQNGSKPSSKLLGDSQAKTWHKTDTDTDIPSLTPPAGKPKQPATPESGEIG
jgi:hypothetical protein